MAYEHILYEVNDRIATITLNRPDRMNAWTPVMERAVRYAMEASSADDNVRVIRAHRCGPCVASFMEKRPPRFTGK